MKKKILIIIILIILIIFISILSFSLKTIYHESKTQNFEELEISIDDNDIRVGESFNISVDNIPDGSKIVWKMGDGNNLSGNRVTYSYNQSGIYSVYVQAKWDNHFGNETINICVKNKDLIKEMYFEGHNDIRIGVQSGMGMFIPIEKGITSPMIKIFINISLASGDVGARVSVSTDSELHVLFTDTQYVFRNEIRLQYNLEPNEYDYFDPPHDISASAFVKQGRIEDYTIRIEAYY